MCDTVSKVAGFAKQLVLWHAGYPAAAAPRKGIPGNQSTMLVTLTVSCSA
jgi:hypothetical protein